MSFEGYTQNLCAKGHLTNMDVHFEYTDKCEVCEGPFVWTNTVDQTNGSYEGDERIDGWVRLEKIGAIPEACVCTCGHKHHKEIDFIYAIPPEGIGTHIKSD